jgi:hypothetical protein
MKTKTINNIIFEGYLGGNFDDLCESVLDMFQALSPIERHKIYVRYYDKVEQSTDVDTNAKASLTHLFIESVRQSNIKTNNEILLGLFEFVLMIEPRNAYRYVNRGLLMKQLEMVKNDCYLSDKWFSRCSEKFNFLVKSMSEHPGISRAGNSLYVLDYSAVTKMLPYYEIKSS